MDSEVIKKNFDYYRQQKGLTMQELASKRGVTPQTLYSYFRQGLTLRTLEKAAALVDVEPWQLLKPAEDQQQTTTTSEAQTICPHCGMPIKITLI